MYCDWEGIFMRRDLAKGDLPALVLALLSRGPLHGYGIAREVKRLSDDALTMKEATLYPALRVLEQDELIVGEWQPQEKGADRKVYTLTEAGADEARKRTQELKDYAALIHTVLGKLDRKGLGHARTA
jgi:PadR family transcriptional regulator PadR